MFNVKVAETESEEFQAYELFYKSFGPTYFDAREDFNLTRNLDPTMKIENLFIVTNEKKEVVAAVRTVKRELKIFRKKFNIGGISSIAVDQEYRGKGLFNLLIQFILKEMIKRELSLCMEFAARRIDNINVPHGFWGAPVERKLIILDPPSIENNNFHYRKIEIEDIPFLEKTYRKTYGKMSVFIDRPGDLWKIKISPRFMPNILNGYICLKNNTKEPAGYLINEAGKGIIEIATNDKDINTYKVMLFSKSSPLLKDCQNGLCLSTEHPAIKALRGHSYSIYTRHPHYGGHILKILDPYNRKSRIMALVKEQLDKRGAKINTSINNMPEYIYTRVITAALFGYEVAETRDIIKIGKNSAWDMMKPVDFFFSSLDEF